jgi:hypothetical protein
MAFADPQNISVGSTPIVLPRISVGQNSSVYAQPGGDLQLSVSHIYGKRNRRTIRLDDAKIAPDVFASANLRHSMSAYLVVDTPKDGYSIAEAALIVNALVEYLAANNDDAVVRLLGGEN